MHPEVTLTVTDERGAAQQIAVTVRRFTVGRDPSNDLAIDDTNLSRRHALLEIFSDAVQLTDCNSSNGTLVNGSPLLGTTTVRDGDRFTLGGTCDIYVHIRSPAASPSHISQLHAAPRPVAPTSVPPTHAISHASRDSNTLLIAALSAFFIVTAAVVVLFFAQRAREPETIERADQPAAAYEEARTEETSSVVMPTDADANASNSGVRDTSAGDSMNDASAEQIERHAAGVMRRIGSDDKPYSFSEKTITDIRRKIEAYRGDAALRNALAVLRRDANSVAAQARANDIEPDFVIYAALAATDGGKSRDPAAAARALIPDLAQLRTTFGSGDADSLLLIVAASTEGTGTKKSHPLLATIRRLVDNPTTQRNVWYLHERDGLSAGAYDLVLRLIALGIIAQHPHDYGIDAAPLVL